MKFSKFMQLTKVDVARNRIYGTFTAEVVDKSGEVADYDTTKAAIQAWSDEIFKISGGKSKGNIRKMHTAEIAGCAVEITYNDAEKRVDAEVEVKPEITAEALKGMLNGFSIGGSYARKWDCPVFKGHQRFTPVIAEVSVVDNPCVPTAVFDAIKDASFSVLKEDGTEELRKFAPKEQEKAEADLPVEELFKAADGSEHKTREAAAQKNTEIAAAKASAPALDALKKLEALAVEPKDEIKKKLVDLLKLEKGMYDVARCASIISDLDWLLESIAAEAAYEEDGSSQPADLKKIIKTLCSFLKAMVLEETKELVTDKAFEGITEQAVEALRKISGKAELFKGWKPAPVEDKNADLNKDLTAENEALKKALTDISERTDAAVKSLTERLKKLEDMPAPPIGSLFSVEKDRQENQNAPLISRAMSPADYKKIL